MTLDEAIEHAEKIAEDEERRAGWFYDKENCCYKKKCVKCAEEHRQLAEWLKDYRQLKSAVEDIKSELEYDVMKFNKRPEISYDAAFSDGIEHALTVIDKHIIEKEQN